MLPGLVLFRQVLADPTTRLPGGNDGILFAWWLGWVPHAVRHGMNPLLTGYLNAPVGVNGMWTTSVPVLGLITAPLVALVGPVVTMNLLFVLAPALSGWACWAAVRRWVGPVPAALAGLVYGYSPYLIGALHGHLHVGLAVFPPLVLGLLHDLISGRRTPLRVGLLLGIAAGVQFFISGEMLVSTMLVALLGLLLLAVLHRDRVRPAVRLLGQAMPLAAAVMLVLALPGLLAQLLGRGRVTGPVQGPNRAVTDLLGFVEPSRAQLLHTSGSAATFDRFTGPAVELGAYLGLPLLLLAVALLVRHRREPLPRFFVALALVVAVASLGPFLHVRGHDTRFPMPWALLQYLPVTEQILPSRLSVFVILLLAAAMAWWLDRCLRQAVPVRLAAGAATVLVLLTLCPTPTLPSATSSTPRFFTTDAVHVLPRGSSVLVVPYAWAGQPGAMLWQAEAGYRFRLVGGYFTGERTPVGTRYFNAPPSPLNLTLIALVQGRMTAAQATPRLAAIREDLASTGATAVVLGPCAHRAEVRTFLTTLIGRPPQTVADVDVWSLGPR